MHMPTARTARLLSLLLVLALCLPAVPAAAPQSSPAPTTTAAAGAQCFQIKPLREQLLPVRQPGFGLLQPVIQQSLAQFAIAPAGERNQPSVLSFSQAC